MTRILSDPAGARVLAGGITAGFFNGLAASEAGRNIVQNRFSAVLRNGGPGSGPHPGDVHSAATEKIKTLTSGKTDEVVYAKVSSGTAAKIKAATGKDVSDHRHLLDRDALTHIDKGHGVGREDQPDHASITQDDVHKIPEIVANPDKVEAGSTSRRGYDSIKYTKRFNGTAYYYEEHWPKDKILAGKTMAKLKAPGESATPKGGVSQTSKTSGAKKA